MTWVGNVCVKKFMDINSGTLSDGLNLLRDNHLARPNAMLIEHAMNKGFLYGEHEYNFLRQMNRKRNISPKQEHWLQKINRRILMGIVVRQLPDQDDENDEQENHNGYHDMESVDPQSSDNDLY